MSSHESHGSSDGGGFVQDAVDTLTKGTESITGINSKTFGLFMLWLMIFDINVSQNAGSPSHH
jgi:hypothetical protein